MLEIEIVVAPALVLRIELGAEWEERVAADAVKMDRVFGEAVIGRQVHAAAEPPDCRTALFTRDKKAQVHVHGRRVGIARMQHQR